MVESNILLVEDDQNMAFLIRENLQANGCLLNICHDGESGLRAFRQESFDLCIVDVMLPRLDGFTLAKAIRKENRHIPVIFLTARNLIEDKEKGFRAGCDDYITKPFHVRELLWRVEAVLKRSRNEDSHDNSAKETSLGNCRFHYLLRQFRNGNKVHNISAKEAELLKVFSTHRNQLLSRQFILTRVWGNDDFFTARSMDVYLTRLRKLMAGDSQLKLQNVHGFGYRLIVRENE